MTFSFINPIIQNDTFGSDTVTKWQKTEKIFFVLSKLTCLVTLFDRKIQVFKNSSKLAQIFNKLFSIQNANKSRFARNVEWDFFFDFQTPYSVGCNFIFANSFVKGDNAERVLVRRAKIDAIHGGIAVGKLLMGCNWLLSHMTTVVVRTHEKMLAQKLTRSILQGK